MQVLSYVTTGVGSLGCHDHEPRRCGRSSADPTDLTAIKRSERQAYMTAHAAHELELAGMHMQPCSARLVAVVSSCDKGRFSYHEQHDKGRHTSACHDEGTPPSEVS